jgi:hypothetical protein
MGTDMMGRSRSHQIQHKKAGTVLLHWTSHMVHLNALGAGAAQREAFHRLAADNFFGLDVLAAGLMHKVSLSYPRNGWCCCADFESSCSLQLQFVMYTF